MAFLSSLCTPMGYTFFPHSTDDSRFNHKSLIIDMRIPKGPLSNLKIVDFSTLLPGPFASMILADMGADVLRVESPTRPDLLKNIPPLFEGNSYAHLTINRNKRSLALDLTKVEATKIIQKLIQEYDIVIEQFRPGVMKKLGLDYQILKLYNPKIIYCSITGYGQTGPLCRKAGHDINYTALSGLASYSGQNNTGPILSSTQIADLAGGSQNAVIGILASVNQRSLSGKGQYLDISMSDGAFSLNTLAGANALATHQNPSFEDQLLNGGSCYDYYKTADDKYLSVGLLEPKFAKVFFDAINEAHLMALFLDKNVPIDALKNSIQSKILCHTQAYWIDQFCDLDACVQPVLSITEAASHQQFKTRKMTIDVPVNDSKTVKQIAPAIQFDGYSMEATAGCQLGQHSVLTLERMGYSKSKIAHYLEQKIIIQS